jgi:Flp pilus assembly pilin Flp
VFAFDHLARRVVALLNDTSGAPAVEYDLMVGAIASVIVVVVYALGVKTSNLYSKAGW